MLHVYLTIDTEFAAGRYAEAPGAAPQDDFARSVEGRTAGGSVGIHYQMDVLDRHGLKGVFFVDPMPALVWGTAAIAAVVKPIVDRGHDVQLHLHTEWLRFAADSPVGGRTGSNIKDFPLDEQVVLIGLARDLLCEAGAPPPVAFRAGNYGANDDTLRALAEVGIAYDTSFCTGIAHSPCAIDLPPTCHAPVRRHGTIEVPIGAIEVAGGARRHAQVTAISAGEMMAAIRHAATQGGRQFTLVSHSFELMSRDRQRINQVVRRRFDDLCARIAAAPAITTGTYRDSPPSVGQGAPVTLLPHNPFRTAGRVVEQIIGNSLYGRR